MKKMLCVILSVLMLLCAVSACAETEDMRTFFNPDNYDLILVTDVFRPDDDEESIVIQGSFGTITTETDESELEFVGFDAEKTFTLRLTDACTVEMPADLMNPVENAATEDLSIWFEGLKASELGVNEFYATFEMDENGDLTAIAYCYLP